MTGFIEELTQPSQLRTAKVTSGLDMQPGQIPAMTFVTKKGSQQMMNTPITVPSVFAALVSLLNLANFLDTPAPFLFTGLPGEDDPSESIEDHHC